MVQRVSGHLELDEEVKLAAEFHHKWCSRGDGVCVKKIRDVATLCIKLRLKGHCVFGRSEATRSLLVHFGSRGHTINREQKYLLGLDGVHELVDGLHDGSPHFFEIVALGDTFVAFGIISVNAVVDNSV